jgi:hypothetical protein
MSKVKVKFLRDNGKNKKGSEKTVTSRIAVHLNRIGAAVEVKAGSKTTQEA